MKNSALLLFLFLSVLVAGQEMSKMTVVGKPEQQPGEIIGGVKDRSGDLCAGIIIESDLPGLTFKSNDGIVKVNSEPGRWFLFVSQDERLLRVYSQSHAPLAIIMNEYGIRVKSGEVWKFVVTGDKKGSDLIPVNFVLKPHDASITVDGQPYPSGVAIELAPGKHSIVISKDGYLPKQDEIEVTTKKTLFSYELSQVDLEGVEISSVPDKARITLNGEEKQKETNAGFALMPGEYTLRLQKSGYIPVEEKISVRAGGNNKFSFRLQKNSGTLELNITPSDARILINKEERSGRTLELVPGTYKIEISKPGFNGISETVEVQLNQTTKKAYTLTAKTGKLIVTVTPIDAEVTLTKDGSQTDKWKGFKSLANLLEGQYTLQVSAAGYETKQVTTAVTEGKTTTEDIVLKEQPKPQPSTDYTTGSGTGAAGEMVFVQGGSFEMGSNDGGSDEKPVHRVYVNDFKIGKYEVTQKEWESVMGNNPSNWKGSSLPVERVSWDDIQEFLRKLNQKTGQNYRLPTEAEWEYAARGGNKSRGYKYSGSNSIDEVAWYDGNSGSKTHPVGTKQPNELGIYDMTGNVWEWCSDWYDENYYGSSPDRNPKGANSGSSRVLRGGSWSNNGNFCRSAVRYWFNPVFRYYFSGFRCVLD